MYIFVLVWGGAVASAAPPGATVPFGKIFSCLMAACAVGSALFSLLSSLHLRVETFLPPVLLAAAVALYFAAHPPSDEAPTILPLPRLSPAWLHLVVCFICFEAAVGVYFPAVGSMRGAHLPDAQRGAIMNITCA
jgi:MFS family permease